MTLEVAVKICEVVGDVLQPVAPNVFDGGSFLRVQVSVDISLPLCRGRLISLNNEKQVWVSFKHERLPSVCYWCGWLTHNDRDCECWIENEGTLRNDQKEFGSDLRAPPFKLSKKNVQSVLGIYAAKKTNCRDGHKQGGNHSAQSRPTEKTTVSEHSKHPTRSCIALVSHPSVCYANKGSIQSELTDPMLPVNSEICNVRNDFIQTEVTGAM